MSEEQLFAAVNESERDHSGARLADYADEIRALRFDRDRLQHELSVTRSSLSSAKAEALRWKVDCARACCHTHEGVTDSGGCSDRAQLLRELAEVGEFRIFRQGGRMVVGYWPENDPERIQYGLGAFALAPSPAAPEKVSPTDKP